MKVIVAGYCKTGTKTMNSALTKLGYNVYDFMDHYYYHEKYWTKIFKDGGRIEDFREMYENVDAVVDVPAFLFWEEMSEAFPEAKIILTTRDEDSWVISMKKQLEVPDDEPFFVYLIRLMCPSVIKANKYFRAITPLAFGGRLSLFGKNDATSRGLRKRYRQHNLDVMQNAPKDKLLVYDVKEGWEPLCKFLEKEVPTTPFPWLNKNGSAITPMINEHPFGKEMQKELIFVTLLLTALIGCLIYICVEKIQVFFQT